MNKFSRPSMYREAELLARKRSRKFQEGLRRCVAITDETRVVELSKLLRKYPEFLDANVSDVLKGDSDADKTKRGKQASNSRTRNEAKGTDNSN